MLSVVIPAYNEEAMLPKTAKVVAQTLEGADIPYEIIFVNDGSKDNTWPEIQKAAADNPHVRGACFSRNFGKESAVFAGLSEAEGDCVAVMDCDLQHPPEKLVEMYHLWQQGYEVVEGVKTCRGKESAAHSFAAKMFYRLISNATGIDMSNASDFKLLDRKAVNVLLNMKEKNAFFRALSSWVGFCSTQVPFEVREREAGQSKWSTKSLIRYALSNITSFTTLPMQIVTFLGLVMFIIMILQGIEAIHTYLIGQAASGFTTVILLLLFIGSIIMMSLGLIGYYIARIFEEVKGRPKFIIRERAGQADLEKVKETDASREETCRRDIG
jgi:glycosyltransferase involved in cell wall biosynthesis